MNTRNSVIGFIGLGAMGSRMAQRLVAADFKVLVFDRKREGMEVLAAQGAAMAPNPRTLAMESDVIMSCLSNDDAVRGVYEGDNGVISSAIPGSIVIEMSTVSPETSRELWRIGKARGVEVLDVAISGGPLSRKTERSRSSVAAAKMPLTTARRFSAPLPGSIFISDPAATAPL